MVDAQRSTHDVHTPNSAPQRPVSRTLHDPHFAHFSINGGGGSWKKYTLSMHMEEQLRMFASSRGIPFSIRGFVTRNVYITFVVFSHISTQNAVVICPMEPEIHPKRTDVVIEIRHRLQMGMSMRNRPWNRIPDVLAFRLSDANRVPTQIVQH